MGRLPAEAESHIATQLGAQRLTKHPQLLISRSRESLIRTYCSKEVGIRRPRNPSRCQSIKTAKHLDSWRWDNLTVRGSHLL
jgi:hypothetical protein